MAIGRISGQMLKANLQRSGTDLAFETNLLVLDVTNSFVGIGTATPSRQLHISGTGAIRLPSGTDAQRGSAGNGDIRYNSDQAQIEGYVDGAWTDLGSGSKITDADGNTGIDVERSADQNQIHFFTETSGDVAHIRDNGNIELNNLQISNQTITGLTTNADITLTPNGTGSVAMAKVNIDNGTVDGTVIGGTSAAAGTFTTLTASTSLTASTIVTNDISSTDSTAIHINDGANISGTLTANTFSSSSATITGGTINNAVIGGTTAAAGTFTTVDTSGNMTVGGDLTVNGTTTTVESTTLSIEDPLIVLAKNNSGGSANTFDQGILFNRGSQSNVAFFWDESADEFVFATAAAETGATAGNVTIDSYQKFHAGIIVAGTSLDTGAIKAADGTAAATIANSTGVITVASSVLTTTDINGGTIDGTAIGGSTAAAGAFTTLTASTSATLSPSGAVTINPTTAGTINNMSIGATTRAAGSFTTVDANDTITISADSKALRIGAGNDLQLSHDGTDTTIANSTGILKINGAATSSIKINAAGTDVDTQISGDTDAELLYVDAGNDRIGISTNTPAYILDIASTGAIRLPSGSNAQRPTAATGVIRFNSDTSAYEGSTDGSTYSSFAMGGGGVAAISKVSTTGDGSTSTFTGFFADVPESAANVMVYIDNVYQEPTENYTVSSNNITFTSAPHSGARIFALVGFDAGSMTTGGVSRTQTDSVAFTSAATSLMDFNATSYRSAELFITVTDTANTEYSCMKANVVHDGTTAFITVYGITNTGSEDAATITATYAGGTVSVYAVSTGGASSAQVQYSLQAV